MRDGVVEVMELEYWLLAFHPPGDAPIIAGVLVFGPDRCGVFIHLRNDWPALVSEDDAEVLTGYYDMLVDMALQMGAARFATLLEDTFSGSVRIERQGSIECADPKAALDQLYRQYIGQP